MGKVSKTIDKTTNTNDMFSGGSAPCKHLEQERLQAIELANHQQQQRIQESEEYRRKQADFIDTLCHELRNPLNGIYGSITLLHEYLRTLTTYLTPAQSLDDKLTQEAMSKLLQQIKDTVKAIEQCSQQQKIIVDDVLNLSKLESNKVELNPLPFNLKQQVTSIIQMFNVLIQQKDLQLIIELPEDLWLKADLHRLSQVFTNLVTNAIKFTSTGFIRIQATLERSSEQEPLLVVHVEDSGIGMTEDEVACLFQRFSQANHHTAPQYGGSGLGLSISKKLVELMGGTIQVTSQKGRGTKFTFTIRATILTEDEKQQAHREQDPPKTIIQLSPKLRHKKILVVEDNVINQKILVNYLTPQGCLCDVAANGVIALEKYQQSHVDFIFMDIEMPVMDGLETTKRIREQERILQRHTPIVGLSGNVRKEQIDSALQAGMDDYLTKPYHKQDVYAVIEKYSQWVLSQPIQKTVSHEMLQTKDVHCASFNY